MTETALAPAQPIDSATVEQVLIGGDLGRLNASQRVSYYRNVCGSIGLNPLTKPFEYINLNGKLTLYAKRDATDQLRKRDEISVKIVAREVTEECYIVTAQAQTPKGRTDESLGAVPIGTLKGEARANAMMKAETKAKRRVTLSICGLGWLDESEIDSVPTAEPVKVDTATGEIIEQPHPKLAADGSVRVIQTKREADDLVVVLQTGEMLKAPMSRKKLCADIEALAPEQPVKFAVSNGVITKLNYVQMTTPTQPAPEREPSGDLSADDIFGAEEPPAF